MVFMAAGNHESLSEIYLLYIHINIPWAHQTYMFRGSHGKYSNLVCKWPKPLFLLGIADWWLQFLVYQEVFHIAVDDREGKWWHTMVNIFIYTYISFIIYSS